MVGSHLKLEEMPSKQFLGYNSDDEDLVMSDGNSPREHQENAIAYGKSDSRCQRSSKLRQKHRTSDDFDDMISSQEEEQRETVMPPNRESRQASRLHQHNNLTSLY